MKGHAGGVGSRQGEMVNPTEVPSCTHRLFRLCLYIRHQCTTHCGGTHAGKGEGTEETGHELKRLIKQGRLGAAMTIKLVSSSCSSPGTKLLCGYKSDKMIWRWTKSKA